MSNYTNFPQHELNCPCGCGGLMDETFMNAVVVPMRLDLGFPFVVPKGGAYRCRNYDGKYGAHQGFALDIICNSRERFKILEWIFEYNSEFKQGWIDGPMVTRIGINNGSIHIDALQHGDGKSVEVVWDYYE